MHRPGISGIELIIVTVIMAIIASVIFVAVDPLRRINATHNARRWSDIRTLLDALEHYQADAAGELPSTPVVIDRDAGSVQLIGEGAVSCESAACNGKTIAKTKCFVSGLDTDLADYLSAIPTDPRYGSPGDTRYYINLEQNGRLTVGACDAAGEKVGGTGAAPEIILKQ